VLAALLVLALVLGVVVFRDGSAAADRVYATGRRTTTGPPTSTTLPRPSITFRAGDFERVAWIDGRGLVTASSARPDPHVLATGNVEQPAFSADGRWIAYSLDGSVHVARAGGGDDVAVGSSVRPFEWSPVGGRLAWLSGTDYLGQLRVTDPATEQTRTIHGGGDVVDFAWSPDGRSLALSWSAGGSLVTGFDIVDADGTNRRPVAFEPATRDHGAGTINVLLFAGWQPDGSAVLVWIDPGGSGSIMQDGLDLWLVPIDGSTPRLLGRTLVKREWVRWSPGGSLVAIVRSSWRGVNDGARTVTVCGTTGECAALTADDVASMDPAWSPDGTQLAYVRKPAVQRMPTVERDHADWRGLYSARQLRIANSDGSDARTIGDAGAGIASPQWSSDGKRISYVRDDALWSIDLGSGRATRVLAPMAPVPKDEYGYQGNLAPPDAPYEAGSSNGFPTWESLLARVR
jgi:Tol biopolymer transport system component